MRGKRSVHFIARVFFFFFLLVLSFFLLFFGGTSGLRSSKRRLLEGHFLDVRLFSSRINVPAMITSTRITLFRIIPIKQFSSILALAPSLRLLTGTSFSRSSRDSYVTRRTSQSPPRSPGRKRPSAALIGQFKLPRPSREWPSAIDFHAREGRSPAD